jgi:hypothetical protein
LAGGSGTWTYENILSSWKNSHGHNDTLLNCSGLSGKYVTFSACYDANTDNSVFVIVIEDVTYSQFYNYSRAVMDELWWENGGSDESDAYWDKVIEIRNYTEAQFKAYLNKKGYSKYYPHL